MNIIIKKFTDLIDKAVKEVMLFTGATVLNEAFMVAFAKVFASLIKNSKTLRIVTMVIGALSAPICVKIIKKQLGYSEEECRSIYDLIKDSCDLLEMRKLEQVEI